MDNINYMSFIYFFLAYLQCLHWFHLSSGNYISQCTVLWNQNIKRHYMSQMQTPLITSQVSNYSVFPCLYRFWNDSKIYFSTYKVYKENIVHDCIKFSKRGNRRIIGLHGLEHNCQDVEWGAPSARPGGLFKEVLYVVFPFHPSLAIRPSTPLKLLPGYERLMSSGARKGAPGSPARQHVIESNSTGVRAQADPTRGTKY